MNDNVKNTSSGVSSDSQLSRTTLDCTSDIEFKTTNYKALNKIRNFLDNYNTYEIWLGILITFFISFITLKIEPIKISNEITINETIVTIIFLIATCIVMVITIIKYYLSKKYTAEYLLDSLMNDTE